MRRLSAQDATFLYTELPTAPMHVAFVSTFDPPAAGAPYDTVRRRLAERLPELPLLRRRVLPVPLGLHHPVLAQDPDFDLARHVLQVPVPAPGGPAELAAVAADLMTRPLDRSRPLWDVHVVEGLTGGGFALVTRLHHAVVDGVSGIELMSTLLGPEPSEPGVAGPAGPLPGALPGEVALVADAAVDLARQPLRLAGALGRELTRRVRARPERPWQALPTPTRVPRSPFNAPVTARRRAALLPLSLPDVRRVKAAFGTTVNDVVLAVVGGALREHLLARGELPATSLVAMAPVSVRTPGQAGTYGNRVSALLAPLGTTVADPVDRLRAVAAGTRAAKGVHDAVAAPELMDWSVLAGPAVMTLAARLAASFRWSELAPPPFTLVVSNVPGPREPLWCGTARLRSLHPLAPLADGLALNISLVSYLDTLDVGLIACPDVVPDVEELAAGLARALAELVAAAA